ncbi:17.6 kDa class I heat shock protein 3 [Camellia lanceoleosa]|nr:17.6 kDa class I heat shock protein 3 [Camellia lanceoleosa]
MSLIHSLRIFGTPLMAFLPLTSLTSQPRLEKPLNSPQQGLIGRRPQKLIYSKLTSGVKKEVVKVEVEEGRILQISGEMSNEEEKTDKWHHVGQSNGKFLQ